MSTFAERFIQQGWERGRLEGALEGRQEGEAAVLLRQLQLKFGELPSAARERVAGADAQTLLTWSERVLTARSLDEVLDAPASEE
ncbi:DUF4351 domain-containing protein [Thiorhodococcus minor]|uniref:DUF4351 domain-containing protein n=1 Tax=Thiorhodococcus minor TaxID=57489 RepID=UPI003CC91D86